MAKALLSRRDRAKGNWICSGCKTRRVHFQPQCGECGRWNTYQLATGLQGATGVASAPAARRLDTPEAAGNRVRTGVPWFDAITGGGLIAGSSALVYGNPGAGKSTLAAQVGFWTAVRSGRPGLVQSGEEWIVQVRDRVERLGLTPGWLWFNSPIDLPTVEADLHRLRPSILIIDSVQKLDDSRDTSRSELQRQKRALLTLLALLRELRTSCLLLSQVNKSGTPLGGRFYEHEPDAVFDIRYADPANKKDPRRELVADKNRFGNCESVKLKMTAEGLIEGWGE
jgi:DNA repair protein RadA/Sms